MSTLVHVYWWYYMFCVKRLSLMSTPGAPNAYYFTNPTYKIWVNIYTKIGLPEVGRKCIWTTLPLSRADKFPKVARLRVADFSSFHIFAAHCRLAKLWMPLSHNHCNLRQVVCRYPWKGILLPESDGPAPANCLVNLPWSEGAGNDRTSHVLKQEVIPKKNLKALVRHKKKVILEKCSFKVKFY